MTVIIIIAVFVVLYFIGKNKIDKNAKPFDEVEFTKAKQKAQKDEDDFVARVHKKIAEVKTNATKETSTDDLAEAALNTVIKNTYNKDLYTIIYCDAEGNPTKRDIIFRNFYEDSGRYYIQAFCLLRNAMRTFATTRILKLWQNGKEIENPTEYFSKL